MDLDESSYQKVAPAQCESPGGLLDRAGAQTFRPNGKRKKGERKEK